MGEQEWAERLRREEEDAHRALSEDDPKALCAVGWHRLRIRSGDTVFFRAGGWGPGPSWLVGPVPFRSACRRIQSLDPNVDPWDCVACGQAVAGKVGG